MQTVRAIGGTELSGVMDVFAERIARFRRAPLPADWDGVYEAETK